MSRRPVIGITPTPSVSEMSHGTFYRYCLSDTYVTSVWHAGGNPVILPWVADNAAEVLDMIDGLILSGGGDIAPTLINQEPHKEANGIDEHRDAFELSLVRNAAERDLPTLAICRGIQVMGVAFGSNLHQHVPDVVSDRVQHRQHTDGYSQHDVSHLVVLENTPNPFSTLLGTNEVVTNSFHHQALADVQEPLQLAGRSEDGVIEAVWHTGMSFGLGVQWHPEMLSLTFEQHARFFTALVAAARQPAISTA